MAGSDRVKWTQVRVPAQLPAAVPCCPPTPDMAGTAAFDPPSCRQVVWRVHKSSPATLEIFELDDNEAHLSGLQLAFEEPLSPFLAVYPDQVQMSYEEGTLSACVVTISGAVYILKIRTLYKYRNVSALARSEMVQFSLTGDLARLDQITSFAALGGSICVGGKNGSILCYPLEPIIGEARDQCFELKDSDALFGRLWGLVARVKSAGPLQSLNMQLHKGRVLLFALHEDGTFRLWDLYDRSRLLNFNLYKGDLTGCTPKMMWVQEQGLRSGSRQIAFLFRSIGATVGDTVHIYDLQFGQMDGAIGQATLRFQLQVPCIQGIVLDLKLLSDSFWKLEEVDGQFNLVCYTAKREELLERCELLEAELEDQLFQKPSDNWEDLILFQQSTITSVKTELQLPVSELFLSRILQPGVFQQHLLHKVLEKNKRRTSEPHFLMLTRDGVRKEILAAIEAENIGDDKLDYLMEWKAFCSDYFTLWKQNNTPYGLILDSHTGSIGLIRRQSLSIKRSLSDFEKLYLDRGSTNPLWSTLRLDSGNGSETDFLGSLFRCTSTISRQLGRLPVSAFGQALLGNKHVSVSHVCSVFLHLLDVGYDHSIFTMETSHFGVDAGRRKKLDYCQQHRKFELQMILDLQHLRDSVGSWDRVLDNIEKYVSHLMQDTRISISRETFEGLEYGIISKRLVLKSTAQLSWTHFEAARDLLLLLGYIMNIKGQVGISTKEVSKLHQKLIVQVKKMLLLSLLVHWLSISFAELAPPEDFSLHLSTLQLDCVAAEKPNNQHLGAGEMTLAEILLSACSESPMKGLFLKSKGLITSDGLLFTTKAFTSWLMWGESSDLGQSFSSHSVALAATLLQHGQYTALQDFLRIVDDICNEIEVHGWQSLRGDWCARLHLMGCGLLGQTRNSLKEIANENRVEKAVHCFFRVASAMGQDGEDLHTLLLKTGMQTSFPVYGSASAWKFQYFEWVMQIFEQNNVSEGACQFAHAALQEVDEAAKSYNTETLELLNAASVIKGRLWANIFKFSLDQKHFKEAYCAIISNPDKESKYICLRRFLIVLCEQKATEVLCGSELPYAGMLERVEQELVWKADYSDITANPNPFKLLYSFHMQRNNWRRAALYMYLYAVRMKETGLTEAHLSVTFVLQEQLNSLAAAINALHLVDSMYAWLDLESDVFGSLNCRPSSKRIRVYANNDAGHLAQRSRRSHVDLGELEKDYALTLAQLLLVEAGVQLNLHGGDLSPPDLLALLVQSGLYEMAFTVLFRFWKNSSQNNELERIFRIMAERWCSRQQENRVTIPSSRALIESERKLLLLPCSEPENSIKVANSSIDVIAKDVMSNTACNSLQVCLEKYAKLHSRLPVVVAETMLSIDRLMELPVWLVDMLKGGRQAGAEGMSTPGADPGALLRMYLDYGRISEAAVLLLDYVKAWANLPPTDVIKRKKMCGVWFPYTLLDRLKAALSEVKKSEQFESLENLLDSTLQRHFNQVETDSNDVKSLVRN